MLALNAAPVERADLDEGQRPLDEVWYRSTLDKTVLFQGGSASKGNNRHLRQLQRYDRTAHAASGVRAGQTGRQ